MFGTRRDAPYGTSSGIMVNSRSGPWLLGYAYQNMRFKPEKSNHNK
jgi:hypothetical protein